MTINAETREKFLKRHSAGDIQNVARKQGLHLMREDGWAKVLKGMTTIEEIVRVTKVDVSTLAG